MNFELFASIYNYNTNLKNMISQIKIENSTEINILNTKINEINSQYKNKIKEG